MKPSLGEIGLAGFAVRTLNSALLRGASLVVPRSQRAEWWREWRGELWQVRRACAGQGEFCWTAEREIANFCLGAFQDALYLRRMDRKTSSLLGFVAPARFMGSAWQCLLFLGVTLGASYTIARLLPGVKAERSMTPFLIRQGMVLIEDADDDRSSRMISSGQYRAWTERKQAYFDGFAFYRVTKEAVDRETVQDGLHGSAGWGVARASSNIFALMGVPVLFRETDTSMDADMPRVILSESVWKRQFGANPHIAGSVVRVGMRRATIAGVAPDGPWQLPGKVDAWLLEPDSQAVPAGAGYVVAHLTNSGKSLMGASEVRITSYAPRRSPDDLRGIKLGAGMPGPWDAFRFGAIMAFLALPAVISVSFGELSVSVDRISWLRRMCRWGFLVAKIVLLLPIAHFASLNLAYGYTRFSTNQALYIQLVATFLICLFGMRWVLTDQWQRCPVCLRRVDHPARVGQLSRTFLAWNGIELMCMGGHTLLHVPALPTSWFGSPRWMFLDASWEFLFAGPVRE
jgi:hypothetical protein